MAIALVATRVNTGTVSTSAQTVTVSPATNTVAGNTLIVSVAVDPVNGPPSAFVSVVDSKGNSYQPVKDANNGSSSSGAAVALFYARLNRAVLTTDTITVTIPTSTATTRVAIQAQEFSGVSFVHNQFFTEVVPPNNSTGNSTTQGSLAQTPTASGQLIYGATGIETNTAVTGDADATNGAWSAVLTTLSNSGSDLTSMTLSTQFKIVTAAGAQNWATTTAVAKLWAAAIVVMAAAPAPTAPTFPEGNPNYPCLLGFEGLPTSTSQLGVDTGTGYIYQYKMLPDEQGSSFQVVGAEYVDQPELNQHHIAYDWYDPNSIVDASGDNIQTIYLPLRRASITLEPGSTAAASVSIGGTQTDAAFLSALSTPGGAVVNFPGNFSNLDLWFDPTALLANFANARIVNIGIQYIAFKDDGAPGNPGQGFSFDVTDTLTDLGIGFSDTIGTWLTNFYKRDGKYETRWIGETNLRPRTTSQFIFPTNPHTLNMGAPWRVADLGHMQAADQSLYFTIGGAPGLVPPDDILQNLVSFDYVVMVVQLAPERRIGAGIRTVSNAYSAFNRYPNTFDWTRFQDPFRTDLLANSGLGTNNYAVLVREAVPASESDYWRLGTAPGGSAVTSLFEAFGPSSQLKAFTQPRESLNPQPNTAFVPIVNGSPYGVVQDFPSYTSSITVFDENDLVSGPSFGGYRGLPPSGTIQVYTGHNSPNVALRLANGVQQYTKLKVLVKSDPANSQSITFSVQQPLGTPIATATANSTTPALTGAAAGNGWYETVLTLSAPITPTAGSVFIVASSSASPGAPWYWAAADPDNGDGQYGYAGATFTPFAATLVCVLPVPTATLISVNVPVFRASGRCLAAAETLPQITFTNGASYDRIVVWRQDTTGEQILVATLDHPTNATVLVDYTVPWDLPANTVKYLVFGERFSTQEAVATSFLWNDISISPGAAIGISYNAPQDANVAQGTYASFDTVYVPGDSSQLKVEWQSLNGTTYVPLHGVDMQYALRSSEQRGLKMTTTVIVDHFAFVGCGTETADYQLRAGFLGNSATERLSIGAQSMSPQVYGSDIPNAFSAGSGAGQRMDLRQLDRMAKPVYVKFPGGHTRLMNVVINSMVTTPSVGLFLAELEFTDAAPLDFLATSIFGT